MGVPQRDRKRAAGKVVEGALEKGLPGLVDALAPGAREKPFPNSEEALRDLHERLQPRGHGPDPIERTYLDRKPEEQLTHVPVPKIDVDMAKEERELVEDIRREKELGGQLPPATWKDKAPFSLDMKPDGTIVRTK